MDETPQIPLFTIHQERQKFPGLSRGRRQTRFVPDTKEKMQKVGFEPLSCTPEQFAEFIKKEMARYGKVIREANLSIE